MAISDEITRLSSAKSAIKTAIEGKGVTVPSSTKLDGYASLISSIPSGGLPAWLKDGDTHLWIEILNSYQLEQQIRIRMIGTIDWGDGTTESISVTTYATRTHTYASTGKYRIDLHPTSGTFYLGGASSSYNVMGATSGRANVTSALYQVEVGSSIIDRLSAYAFYYCRGIVRAYIPKNITSIGGNNVFGYCYSLREVEFEDSTKITSDPSYFFYYCQPLQKANFTPTCTTLSYVYRYCASLSEITIPSSVTSLGQYALASCTGLKKLKCKPTTPPTVSNTNTFTDFPTDCVIEVPSASLNTYKTETNWSTYASQMVGV